MSTDDTQQGREARRQRFNVDAEAVERRKAEMTAAELKYRRATAKDQEQEQELLELIQPIFAALLTDRYGGRATVTERQRREAPDLIIVTEDPMTGTVTAEVSTDYRRFSRGLSYPDPVDWSDEEEGEVTR